MKVVLNLYASLGQYIPAKKGGNSCDVEIEAGTTVGELLDRLRVPAEAPKVIFLNGVHADREAVLKEGDRVSAFPPVAGG
jgi:molybdopterin converting factor small subunit